MYRIMNSPRRLFAALSLMAAVGLAPVAAGQTASTPSDSALVAYARWAWQTAGRAQLGNLEGMTWDSTSRRWSTNSGWSGADDAGAAAYESQLVMSGLIGLAQATSDHGLLTEAAQFFVDLQARFRTVGQIRAQAVPGTGDLPTGDATAKTFPWLHHGAHNREVIECVLCNGQALHPAARLVHLVAALPPDQRTDPMREFLTAYVPLLAHDHVVRQMFQENTGHKGWPSYMDHRISRWEAISAGQTPPIERYQYVMTDADLWLLATAAELLEAHRLDPGAVPLGADEESLKRVVSAGRAFLQKSITPHPDTKDLAGQVAGSLGYFEGDYDTHPEHAYTGYAGASYPGPADKRAATGVSWDISHLNRLPVALRSLWDARQALGPGFPDSTALRLTTNQYLYRAFNGDWQLPAFRNFFDGSDGWYRVDYDGQKNWAYPPSTICDNQVPGRLCLSGGGVRGWGVLAFVSPDLDKLGQGLFRLASDPAAPAKAFRARVYVKSGEPMFLALGSPTVRPSLLLFQLIGEYLAGRHS